MDYWVKQTTQPLFEDIEWNKPERRDQSGRLLIIGGSKHALGAPAESYEIVQNEGIGQVSIALPDKVRRLVGSTLTDALFLPSTNNGELNADGERELLEHAMHSDTLLIPGDLGRNSQTTILLESTLKNYNGPTIITRDAIDVLTFNSKLLINRSNTTLVLSFAQLQKLLKTKGRAITFSMDLIKLVENLHNSTLEYPVAVITLFQNQAIVASSGNVSTTKLTNDTEPAHWRTKLASLVACYQTWNPNKPFEALTYAGFRLRAILTS